MVISESLNGQATRVDTESGLTESVQVIDLSLINPKVQKAVAEMVCRTTLAGAWQAAYDYANNKFSGLDLTFAIVARMIILRLMLNNGSVKSD